MIWIICIFFTSSYFNRGSRADTLLWQPSSRYDASRNWSPSNATRSRCDTVVFPSTLQVPVLIDVDAVLKELLLPLDGLLTFAEGSSLHFSDGHDAMINTNELPCSGNELEYLGIYSDDLFDSSNYCFEGKECPRSDLVEIDQIPNESSDVVFQRDGHFHVDLSEIPIELRVKSITANGKKYEETLKFSKFLMTDVGSKQFLYNDYKNATHIVIRHDMPDCNKYGTCHHNQVVKEFVCSLMRCSDTPTCHSPAISERSCCPLCYATILRMELAERLNVTLLRRVVDLIVDTKRINVKIAVVNDKRLEIIFQDLLTKDENLTYREVIKFMRIFADGELLDFKQHSNVKFNIIRSQEFAIPRKSGRLTLVSALSRTFYVFAGLLLLSIVFVIYCYMNDGRLSSFIARMPLLSRWYARTYRVQRIVENIHIEKIDPGEGQDLQFTNPIYNCDDIEGEATFQVENTDT